jgi:hypothetical protein
VSRQYRPAGDTLATLLAGRVDSLEQQLAQNTGDVTALGRGVADLTTQIRQLANAPAAGGSEGGSARTEENGEAEEDEPPVGQPDWFAVTEPETAIEILTTLTGWVQSIGTHHGIALPLACWGLHPDVVAALLALATERDTAYTGPQPTPVSEWLARWLPAGVTAITTALAGCAEARAHTEGGIAYDLAGFDPISAGPWWALDRTTPAVVAFALPALT